MLRVTYLLQKIADMVLGYQHALLCVALPGLALATFGASQIKFDDGAQDLFVSSQTEYQLYERHANQYPRADTDIVVYVHADRTFSGKALAVLRDFILDVQLVDGVELAVSIFSLQRYDGEQGEFRNLIDDNLGDDTRARNLLTKARDSKLTVAPLVNENLNETVILLSVADELTEANKAKAALAEINQLASDAARHGDMKFELTGLIPIRDRIITRLTTDQIVMTGVGGLLGLLISLILFRSLWVGLLNGIAPMIALLLTFGCYGFLGLEMNLITNAVPVLILVLAMADCIHMTYEMRIHSANGLSLDEAISKTLTEMGPPCILASLTTMLALSGLFYSESPLIQSFAIAGIIGLCMTLIATIFVHPLVYVLTWRFAAVESAFRNPLVSKQFGITWLGRATGWLVRRKYLVMAASIALTAALLAQFLPIQTNYRFYEFLQKEDEMVRTLERAEAISGPTQSLVTTLRVAAEAGASTSDVLDDLGRAQEAIQRELPDHIVISFHSFREMLARETGNKDDETLDEMLELLPDRVRDNLISRDGQAFNLSILIKDAPSGNIRTLSERIEAALRDTRLEYLTHSPVTGYTAMAAYVSDQMIWDLAISFLIAAFVCPVFIALWFRRWQYGVASVLPNVIPILAVGAWLMASGWHLQFASAVALSIAFGVAIDDTVHMLNRLDIERRKPSNSSEPVDLPGISRHIAPALITTTLVLSVGLLSTLLSQIPTMTFFGMLCIVIFVLALLADLFLLPPMIHILGETKIIGRSDRHQ